jgi:hypothetical protein
MSVSQAKKVVERPKQTVEFLTERLENFYNSYIDERVADHFSSKAKISESPQSIKEKEENKKFVLAVCSDYLKHNPKLQCVFSFGCGQSVQITNIGSITMLPQVEKIGNNFFCLPHVAQSGKLVLGSEFPFQEAKAVLAGVPNHLNFLYDVIDRIPIDMLLDKKYNREIFLVLRAACGRDALTLTAEQIAKWDSESFSQLKSAIKTKILQVPDLVEFIKSEIGKLEPETWGFVEISRDVKELYAISTGGKGENRNGKAVTEVVKEIISENLTAEVNPNLEKLMAEHESKAVVSSEKISALIEANMEKQKELAENKNRRIKSAYDLKRTDFFLVRSVLPEMKDAERIKKQIEEMQKNKVPEVDIRSKFNIPSAMSLKDFILSLFKQADQALISKSETFKKILDCKSKIIECKKKKIPKAEIDTEVEKLGWEIVSLHSEVLHELPSILSTVQLEELNKIATDSAIVFVTKEMQAEESKAGKEAADRARETKQKVVIGK